MDDNEIRSAVRRLARPHPSGGRVIERAAILASGSGSSEVLQWITEHGAVPEATPVVKSGGLFGGRIDESTASRRAPERYVLPPGALS
jgi:hypothetical protein